jgi:hypothetical protein
MLTKAFLHNMNLEELSSLEDVNKTVFDSK